MFNTAKEFKEFTDPWSIAKQGSQNSGNSCQEYIHPKLIQTVQMYRLHNSRFWINRDIYIYIYITIYIYISASCINISHLYLPIYPGCVVKHAGMSPAAVPPSCPSRARNAVPNRALSGARAPRVGMAYHGISWHHGVSYSGDTWSVIEIYHVLPSRNATNLGCLPNWDKANCPVEIQKFPSHPQSMFSICVGRAPHMWPEVLVA